MVAFLGFLAMNAMATTYYVNINSANPTPPYTSWSTASTDIQSAINQATNGDLVLVTNGTPPYQPSSVAIYQLNGANAAAYSNRVVVLKPITVQSVNGPALTWIEGSPACRGVYLTNGAILSGFTITNGWAGGGDYGGGIYAQSTNAVITNCIISGCNAAIGSGAYSGTFYDCLIQSNSLGIASQAADLSALYNSDLADNYGGMAVAANSTLNDCILSNNASTTDGAAYESVLTNCILIKNSGTNGGGAYGSTLYDCLLVSNTATDGGGAYGGALYNCSLISNTASQYGGAAYGQSGLPIILNNCLVCSNSANFGGGALGASSSAYCLLTNCTLMFNSAKSLGGAAYFAQLYNCLIVSNSAADVGGGASGSSLNNCTVTGNSAPMGGGTYEGTIYNSIIYNNLISTLGSSLSNYDDSTLSNCCTLPAASGAGNITNNPAFVNAAAGDFQLQSNSPCINSGNNAYVTTATDLDGNPRIIAGTVDIGAYEYQTPVSMVSYYWLQQYGLPITINIDTSHPNGTSFDVYQDWVAGLNPTNPASVLAMFPPAPTNNASGIKVSWESVSNILYNLQRSTNLPAFTTLQTNLTGQVGTTSYTDTTATNKCPYFYRVGVQAP